MVNLATHPKAKRPVNLLLTEQTVDHARAFTDNLSATVEALLTDFIAKKNDEIARKQQHYDAISQAWNAFHEREGSFADEYSTL